MPAQGSQLFNTDYIANLTASINAAGSCAELQALAGQSLGSLDAIKAGIETELASLQPVLSLLKLPSADPGAIVGWLNGLVTNLVTPQIKPTITYAEQLTALADQVATLTSTLQLAATKFPSCSISTSAA